MASTLLLGNEALALGAAHGGADFFAAYPLSCVAEIDRALSEALARDGAVVRTTGAAGAANAAAEAGERGRLGFVATDKDGLTAVAPVLERAARARIPLVLVVVGEGGPASEGPESASQPELAVLRWSTPAETQVFTPASAGECYALAHAAAGIARRDRVPVVLYADGAIALLREPVEVGSGSPANAPAPVPSADFYRTRDASLLVVAVGIVARAARTAVRVARERGLRAGLFRPIRLWPLAEEDLAEAAARARRVLVAELNEGQLWEPVAARLQGSAEPPRVEPIAGAAGGRISPERILAALEAGRA